MEQVPVRVTYHRQRSSTGRIRGGQIHLRISNLVSRREQEQHVVELTEKMMEAWGRLGDARERVSLVSVFDVEGPNFKGQGPRNDQGGKEIMNNEQWRMGGEADQIHNSKISIPDFEDEDDPSFAEATEDIGVRLRFKEREVGVYPGVLRMSTGVEYKVKVRKVQGRRAKVQKIASVLHVLWPVSQDFDADEAEKILWTFLAKDQVAVLEDRLNELREGWIDEGFSVLKLKQVMTRWGSCEKQRGIIMLSVKLLFMDSKLLDYVCVHELAHLRHANHADLFWDLVAEKMPDWKVRRKRLRGFE